MLYTSFRSDCRKTSPSLLRSLPKIQFLTEDTNWIIVAHDYGTHLSRRVWLNAFNPCHWPQKGEKERKFCDLPPTHARASWNKRRSATLPTLAWGANGRKLIWDENTKGYAVIGKTCDPNHVNQIRAYVVSSSTPRNGISFVASFQMHTDHKNVHWLMKRLLTAPPCDDTIGCLLLFLGPLTQTVRAKTLHVSIDFEEYSCHTNITVTSA